MNDDTKPIVPVRCDFCGEIALLGGRLYNVAGRLIAHFYVCHCESSRCWRGNQRTEEHFPTWREA